MLENDEQNWKPKRKSKWTCIKCFRLNWLIFCLSFFLSFLIDSIRHSYDTLFGYLIFFCSFSSFSFQLFNWLAWWWKFVLFLVLVYCYWFCFHFTHRGPTNQKLELFIPYHFLNCLHFEYIYKITNESNWT